MVQTPWFHGSHTGDFVIADLEDLLKKRNAVKPGYHQVKQVFLQLEESVNIKSLSGFKKGQWVPDSVNSATQSFVGSIAQKEVNDEIEQVFQSIRNTMSYKRKDLTAESGRIIAPDFEFSVAVAQDPEDPSSAVITRQLINISPAIVGDESFNEVFDDSFNELTLGACPHCG